MNPDSDTLATALHVRIDDLLAAHPEWAPRRSAVGFVPRLSDAELVTLAVVSALLGFDNESRFVRYARAHLWPWFRYLPNRAGFNKRLRRSGDMIARVIERLARECPDWNDDVWLVDSTPVQRGRSRETQRRSDPPGWAQYGWCAVSIRAPRRPAAEAHAPDHRIGQPDTQSPAQPRTSPRTHPRRRRRAHPDPHTRPHRRHLAQPNPPQHPTQPLTDPLRPPI